MNLLVKFNLIFIVVLGAGLAVASISARSYLRETAGNESIQDARMMLETTLATRDYTQKQIRPLLQKLQTPRPRILCPVRSLVLCGAGVKFSA